MTMRHLVILLYRITLLAAMPLILCSCATIPVSEIVPPPASSPVRLELSSGVSTSCRYADKRPVPTLPTVRLEDADFDALHRHQERVIEQSRRLVAESDSSISATVAEWIALHDLLGADMDAVWSRESDRAYRTIASNLLTYKQRARLQKYERNGLSRDMAWGKLGLTPEQRGRMLPMYLDALQKAHPAWSASSAVSEAVHARLDAALLSLPDMIREADTVVASIVSLRSELEGMEKKYRDAERQVTWLDANLKVSKDAAEQIRLRKAIADQRADAEQFKIAATAQQRRMSQFAWRDEEITRLRDTATACGALVKAVHDAHLRVLSSVTELRGKTAEGVSGPYAACRQAVAAALGMVIDRKNEFPDDIKGRVSNMKRRIE